MPYERIRVMISSRCNDSIKKAGGGTITLTKVRKKAKETIDGFRMFDRETFECWVHEHEPTMDNSVDPWEHCLNNVRRCNVLLVLFNGNAGSAKGSEDIGICHAEVMAAMENAGAKVRVVDVTPASAGKITGDEKHNLLFQSYLKDTLDVGRRFANDEEETLRLLLDALQEAVVNMVQIGGGETRKGRFDTGAPLDWSRYDYSKRKATMEDVVRSSVQQRGATASTIYFRCHAVPAAMSVPAARELVGRPFLHDHEFIGEMKDALSGPVHIIACHKGITENQAVGLLGFPDATIITPPFGVYVADNIQKVQLVFLANCRDESSTRYAVQRFFDWLNRSGEATYLADRARGRKAIVSAIAEQFGPRVKAAGR